MVVAWIVESSIPRNIQLRGLYDLIRQSNHMAAGITSRQDLQEQARIPEYLNNGAIIIGFISLVEYWRAKRMINT